MTFSFLEALEQLEAKSEGEGLSREREESLLIRGRN